MRLSFFICLAAFLQVSGASVAQKITIDKSNTTLREILKDIRNQSGYSVFYDVDIINTAKHVDIHVKNSSVDDALKQCFIGQPLTYIINNNTILVTPIPPSGSSAKQAIAVSGTVTDDKNVPLIGVSVKLENSSTGVVTNSDGRYSITVPDANAVLVFSYVGFTTQKQTVGNNKVLNIKLLELNSNLNEIVVVGYGTVKRKDLTGAVTQVKATELENQHPNSIGDLLRGNVPGLTAGFSASPKGGENNSLLIRGKSTLTAGTTPLLVLDGVIYPGDLSDINPYDIATIDVLKDASSAAVYGAKAASGVIVITTKRGKTSKPVININTTVGYASREESEHLYDGPGFINYRSQVLYSINGAVPAAAADLAFTDPRTLPSNVTQAQWFSYDNTPVTNDPVTTWLGRLKMFPVEIANYKAGKVTNWEDLTTINGLRQDHTMSISGKKEEVSYYLSGGYTDNNGVTLGDEYKVARGRMNIEAKAAKFAVVGVNLQYSSRDQSAIPIDLTAVRNASPYGQKYNADGVTLRDSPNDDTGNNANPFADYTYRTRMLKYNNIFSTMYLKGDLPAGFSYSVNLTPTYNQTRDFSDNNSKEFSVRARKGTAYRQESTSFNWQIDNILKWNKTIAKIHTFDVTLLYNAEKNKQSISRIENEGFDPNDNLGYHGIGSGIKAIVADTDQVKTGTAMMARVNYSLMSKYLLTVTVRRDGASVFGLKHPYGTFPLAALAWNFGDESFTQKFKWLNSGKLRVSYGSVGNSDISNYLALSDLSTGKYLNVTQAGVVVPVTQLFVNRMTNEDLKWEATTSFNLGLDLALFNNRITTTIDVYDKNTKNDIVVRALPTVTGFANVASNLGAVNNRGIEISASSRNIVRDNFIWNTSATFSYNRNTIRHLYGKQNQLDASGNVIAQVEVNDPGNGWFIGHDKDAVWDYKVLGVWQTNQAADAAKVGLKPGDFRLQDVNGDGKFTDADKQFLGTKTAPFTASLRNQFTLFKRVDFSFSMYSYWGSLWDFNDAKNASSFPDRQNAYILPYWTPQNPINDYARLYSSSGSASYSIWRNNSFIRLDNVSLAYSLPKNLIQKLRLENVKVFGTVQNAAVYAPQWSWWDPQNRNPTPRYITFGLNVTL